MSFTRTKVETRAFTEVEGHELEMDIYYPPRQRADKACVIALHGGGFFEGARYDDWSLSAVRALIEKGFVVFSIDYRLGMQNVGMFTTYSSPLRLHRLMDYCIDLAVEDCVSAIAYVYSRAEDFGVDREKIILTGCSSGAIVALQMDYLGANERLPYNSVLPRDWRPAAIVSYSGAVMCKNSDFHYHYPPASTMLFCSTKDKIVRPGRTPCSISKSFFGSKRIYRESAGDPGVFWLIEFPGVGHEVSMILPETVDLFCAFADRALAGKNGRLVATMDDARVVPTEWTTKTIFDLMKENSQKMGLS